MGKSNQKRERGRGGRRAEKGRREREKEEMEDRRRGGDWRRAGGEEGRVEIIREIYKHYLKGDQKKKKDPNCECFCVSSCHSVQLCSL